MSYGIRTFNSAGAIVFDSEDPVLQAVGKFQMNLAYTLIAERKKTVFNESGTASWVGPDEPAFRAQLPRLPNGAFYFFEINPGVRVHAWNKYPGLVDVFSNVSSLRVIKASWAKDVPTPSGYGMAVWNKKGEPTWVPDHPIVQILGTLKTQHPQGRWFAFEHQILIPAMSHYLYGARGVRATSGGFVKEAWGLSEHLTGGGRAASGGWLAPYNKIRGLCADIDWDEIA